MGANISYNELAQGFNATYRIAFYFIDESVQMKIKDMMGDLFYSYCDEKDLTSHSLLDKPDLIIAGRRDMQLSYLKEVCLANDLVVSKEKVDGAI